MNDRCQESIEIIDSSRLLDLLEDKEEQPLLIDVRQPSEYEKGHIPGAVLIPLGQLEFGHPSLDRNKKIVTYCRSGKRSFIAAKMLCQEGFPRVMSLNEGILGWKFELLEGPPREVLTPEETSSALDIFSMALQKENKKHHFYTVKHKEIRIQEIKTLLKNLASWEKRHLDIIYQKYVNWSERNLFIPKSLDEMKGVSAYQTGQDSIPSDIADPAGLLEAAVEQEYEAYNFYKVSAEMMKDEELRGILLDLSFEERTHASYLLSLIPNYS